MMEWHIARIIAALVGWFFANRMDRYDKDSAGYTLCATIAIVAWAFIMVSAVIAMWRSCQC